MAQFVMMKSETVNLIESLGNTSQMKNIISALANIDSENGKEAGKGGWKQVKEAFEKFGFTVCYDRNLALLTIALFAAIARSKCPDLVSYAQIIINKKAKSKRGELISLGQAFLDGDGHAIYEILSSNLFKKILEMIGIDYKYIKKYLARIKRIISWRKFSGSKKYLEVIKNAFENMTGEELKTGNALRISPTVVINTQKDFKKIKNKKIKGSITTIIISDGIKTIPKYAFFGCESLKEVIIPNSVTEIEGDAFGKCLSIEEIKIPNSVVRIGDSVFFGCKSLKTVTIPTGVTEISGGLFIGCKSLKKITIPNSVTEIGRNAFGHCPIDMKILGDPRPEIKSEIERRIGRV